MLANLLKTTVAPLARLQSSSSAFQSTVRAAAGHSSGAGDSPRANRAAGGGVSPRNHSRAHSSQASSPRAARPAATRAVEFALLLNTSCPEFGRVDEDWGATLRKPADASFHSPAASMSQRAFSTRACEPPQTISERLGLSLPLLSAHACEPAGAAEQALSESGKPYGAKDQWLSSFCSIALGQNGKKMTPAVRPSSARAYHVQASAAWTPFYAYMESMDKWTLAFACSPNNQNRKKEGRPARPFW
jgi:hypothetical protein